MYLFSEQFIGLFTRLGKHELFKEKNQQVMLEGKTVEAVFMVNSITQGWADMRPHFFTENSFVNRGIGGQTTPQMLLRFRQDVIDLKPKAVFILARHQ